MSTKYHQGNRPFTVAYQGKEYTCNDKPGQNVKTGEACWQYRCVDDSGDGRVWLMASGEIQPDCA